MVQKLVKTTQDKTAFELLVFLSIGTSTLGRGIRLGKNR
jgi:hypothetical protein